MARRRKGRDVHGVLLLDKPAGLSSNQALQRVRRLYQAKKAGHTGNLDPFATGMLPICLGEASKTAGFMLEASKVYRATARLGEATETGDTEGEVIETCAVPELDFASVSQAMQRFIGEVEQVPPMYSALKHQGQPLYRLAREGRVVERKARRVRILSLDLLRLEPPELEFRVHCSKGTYVRTLAEDLARKLGTCAHLQELRRERVEPFDIEGMRTLPQLEELAEHDRLDDALLPVDSGLPAWPRIELDAAEAQRFQHGNPVSRPAGFEGNVRVYGPGDHLLGLGARGADGKLRPIRVMHIGR
jgi:tRNA pseudouridine55 synthase